MLQCSGAGGLYAFRDKPFAEEDKKIMKRFASVVNLTYNRFLDLQKAEAHGKGSTDRSRSWKEYVQKQWLCIAVMM